MLMGVQLSAAPFAKLINPPKRRQPASNIISQKNVFGRYGELIPFSSVLFIIICPYEFVKAHLINYNRYYVRAIFSSVLSISICLYESLKFDFYAQFVLSKSAC